MEREQIDKLAADAKPILIEGVVTDVSASIGSVAVTIETPHGTFFIYTEQIIRSIMTPATE